jgi:hypothetical protein
MAASSREGLGQLQVAVGLLAVGEVQLSAALGFGADHGIQPGVLAGSGQLHVQPVHVLAAGQADQGPASGQPLGPVAGGGIGQVHPTVALPASAAIQIRPRQDNLLWVGAVQAEGQGPFLGIKGRDGAAAAVRHPQLGDGVVPTDNPVPDRQLTVLDLQPLAAQAAAGREELLASGVEPVHLDPAGGQHDHLLAGVALGVLVGGPPGLEQGEGGGRLGVGRDHPVMRLVGGHRLLHQPRADEVEGFAFPGLLLPPILREFTGPEAEPQSPEAAAGVDRRQLPVIADQHHLGLGLVGVLQEPGELAAADHAGLIDHQHRAGVQLLMTVVQVEQEPVAGDDVLEPLALQAQGGDPGRGRG